MKRCEVSSTAYRRGYGTKEEISQINNQLRESPPFNVATYINLKPTKKEKNVR